MSVDLLTLLNLTPSEESLDYVRNKTQFHLHTLLTEQRHTKTWNLSDIIEADIEAGLKQLFSVDEDITARFDALCRDGAAMAAMEAASARVAATLRAGKRIYVYGCGATGRLAKQMESNFWRPFWSRLKALDGGSIWSRVESALGSGGASVCDMLVGEMTGGDRALIASLEGFEDLQLVGRLQLLDHGIKKGDMVICVTEGGETSSVIGTILTAVEQWKEEKDSYDPSASREHLYYVYNNPDAVLMHLDRSRTVIQEPGITKLNLATGPQAITGSTRMQATSSETYVVASILADGIERFLRDPAVGLSPEQLTAIGFAARTPLTQRLARFDVLQKEVAASASSLAALTRLEADAYAAGFRSTYFTDSKGLVTVFIDGTERSPTFRLFPLDTIEAKERKCWFQVWTAASNASEAWTAVLGRPFRGLASDFYKKDFEEQVTDPYLRRAALTSLARAGDEQQHLYDFAFAQWNKAHRGPTADEKAGAGDIGVAVLVEPDTAELANLTSFAAYFLAGSPANRLAVLIVGQESAEALSKQVHSAIAAAAVPQPDRVVIVPVKVTRNADPLLISPLIALKLLLNAHSTAVMARLGRVVGNTMTNVSPSNLKLIGRATALILSHVNDILPRILKKEAAGEGEGEALISYPHANAALYDSIRFLEEAKRESDAAGAGAANALGQTAELALTIVRIVDAVRTNTNVSCKQALATLNGHGGLAGYIKSLNLSR